MNTDTQKPPEPKRTAIEKKAIEYVAFVIPKATADERDTAIRAFCAGCAHMNRTMNSTFNMPEEMACREISKITEDVQEYFLRIARDYIQRRANQ